MKNDYSGGGTSQTKPTIFWIMPFQDKFQTVYRSFKNKLGDCYKFLNAEETNNQGNILVDIIPEIIKSDFVIADVSPIDKDKQENPRFNANVMFELAIAMAYRRKVIMISNDIQKPPFDIGHYRINPYTNDCEKITSFIQKIDGILQDSQAKYSNPISDCDEEYDLVLKSELEQLRNVTQQPNQQKQDEESDKFSFILDFGESVGKTLYQELRKPTMLDQVTLDSLKNISSENKKRILRISKMVVPLIQDNGKENATIIYGIPSEEDYLNDFATTQDDIKQLQEAGVLENEIHQETRFLGGKTGSFRIEELGVFRTRKVFLFTKKFQKFVPLLPKPTIDDRLYFATGNNPIKNHLRHDLPNM